MSNGIPTLRILKSSGRCSIVDNNIQLSTESIIIEPREKVLWVYIVEK